VSVHRALLHGGWLSAIAFALAVAVCGALTPAYEPARHAIGLLGSAAAAYPAAFNVTAFVLPGMLLAGLALALETPLRTAGVGRGGRIATYLMLISALAFTAQGGFPFVPRDSDGVGSRRHVVAYSIAMLAWLPSTALYAFALRARGGWAALSPLATVLAASFALLLAFPADTWIAGVGGKSGYAQRILLSLYFAWPALLALGTLRATRNADLQHESNQSSRKPK
jgi:hypothetical membrane protein